ncbi:catalase [Paracoccus aestuarii]|uniref:Catalase n=1 Tax=Paracoccus aestuarii TaxID=453842 RepID=A0A418ZUK5_9RHOB|nr:catalase [Paracoccus aestuarii]RJL01895.1 catalase [Paracoccus aestuarii]WCQ99700.1 catalase [Paracoccus aestuarii]
MSSISESRGQGGETHQTGGEALTTNHGVPISDNQNSLRAGSRGPTLLEDFVLREKIFHFDHERIPERIVHARGSGAHGYFECTDPIPELTRAGVLANPGKTPVFVRFSTVAGGAGSVDTPRDVRGFAVKFYTEEGNWDLVGNNIPVFFIQDAIKFPDLIHSVKMESDKGYPQAASAHDTFWDFVSLMPESMHMIMWAMSDRGIPRSLRMIEGFGVHTFRLVNAEGKSTFVKFHWKPRLGLQSQVWNEAVKTAGANQDYHRQDLWEAIEAGDFPEWDLAIQTFDAEWAEKQPYDVLDATKLIPEEDIPVRIVGKLVLDRNPDNFFAETEQVAFLPTNVVPGIDFTDDPLLQGRLFSYLDTQKSRLGTTNFHQIPVNAPKCPMHNFQRDGMMQMAVPKGRANYEPNSLDQAGEDPGPRESEQGFATVKSMTDLGNQPDQKLRVRSEKFADHYSQARLFYRSQTDVEQRHIADAITFELSKVGLGHVIQRILGHLRVIDEDLAAMVAEGLAEDLPEAAKPFREPIDMAPSDALSIAKSAKYTMKGRKVGILIGQSGDQSKADALKSALEAEGATVELIAKERGRAEAQLAGSPSVLYDAVALVLGEEDGRKMAKYKPAIDFVSDAFAHAKAIGTDGAAQPLLDAAGVEKDEGVVDLDPAGFVKAASRRYYAREEALW